MKEGGQDGERLHQSHLSRGSAGTIHWLGNRKDPEVYLKNGHHGIPGKKEIKHRCTGKMWRKV
ncbi:hypothetical protein E2C01_067556 [Portunus trituberculatus]|uniref:Uncharacterized protein n=1 Tax=Portunus trituberculatus TaxID=210409 RepID=A0A5B7HXR0_PORTR|nr:hypothetical protein [Portunus trituberculatus]